VPDGFDELYRKLLGLDESFSVKSHYPGFKSAEHSLVESAARLAALNENLERIVERRTEELRSANSELEERSRSLELALAELRGAQDSLVQTRYQASVGRVLASIAHELNSPLASAVSSAAHLASMRESAIDAIAALRSQPEPLAALVERLVKASGDDLGADPARKRALAQRLAALGCEEPDGTADDLADLGAADPSDGDVALVAGPGGAQAVEAAWALGSLFEAASLAAEAARRSALVVMSLNSYLEVAGSGDQVVSDFELAESLRSSASSVPTGPSQAVAFDLEDGILVHGDRVRLELVWINLFKNALHSAGTTGRVEIRSRREGGYASVAVEDDGPGIDPSIRDRIFEPLFSTKGTGEGKGLGLDTCRRIVDTHSGTITFESRPGRTVFTVRLPEARDGAVMP